MRDVMGWIVAFGGVLILNLAILAAAVWIVKTVWEAV